ncbi:stalk domain-containing protein [Paenibacillus sp. FSL R5-0623]|uniref:stalk domain-containing protein n=1 Tax=Paenibacillus sp. FSL R5-0623 TaxID=2921651 RepID=UPI0030D79CA4
MKFPDAKPFQDGQGSVMVPIRFVSEALGAKVTYSKVGKVTKVGIIDLVKDPVRSGNVVQIRSSVRGNPISFLVKNSFAKGRQVLDAAFINNGDKTGMNNYPVVSSLDLFQNGKFVENYDYTKFKLSSADYILLSDGDLDEYAVAIINPFK